MRIRAVFFFLLVILRSNVGENSESSRREPFSDIINWDDETARKEYEKLLRGRGLVIRERPLVRLDTEPLAAGEKCVYFLKNGARVGYGVVLTDIYSKGRGIGEYTVDFELKVVEVLYDNSGQYVVLVTYHTLLPLWQRLLLYSFPKFKKHKLDDTRKVIRGRELSEDVVLDGPSMWLLEEFIALPALCLK